MDKIDYQMLSHVDDGETQPLYTEREEPRRWRNHFLCIAGDCSAQDWVACCTVWNAPCLAFGWNAQRGLKLTCWKETLKFALMAFGGVVLFYVLIFATIFGCKNYDDVDSDGVPVCVTRYAPWLRAANISIYVGIIATIIYGAYRRKQLRERFGIPGHFAADCILWMFCMNCALAQETRTMMHHHVENGVWDSHKQECQPQMFDAPEVVRIV